MKLYTEEQARQVFIDGMKFIAVDPLKYEQDANEYMDSLIPIELPSDEEIESKYNKFIDTEIQLKFLKQEQGERLKWYYKEFFIKYK
ncbi:MAG: hypothetical protein ACOVNU_04170 [Candidatus Kapaibacteriota bacterium]